MRSVIFLIGFCVNAGLSVFADHTDPTTKTNVNVQTDLFEKSAGSVERLKDTFEADKGKAMGGINNEENVKDLSGKSKNEIEKSAAASSSIKPLELNSKGREELEKNHDLQDMYINETRPGFAAHARDAKIITEASSKLLGDLTGMLKEIGVDCRTVKGNKEIEPDYRIEIAKEKTKDTVYNKVVCEDLRNQYACTDSLQLTCRRKEMAWEDWQDREIAIDGWTLYWYHNHWGYEIYWKRKRHGWHIGGRYPSEARVLIANRIGAKIEQIHETIGFPPSGRGIGNLNSIGERWRLTWDKYVFRYKYRDGHEICVEWGEEWTERCRLR